LYYGLREVVEPALAPGRSKARQGGDASPPKETPESNACISVFKLVTGRRTATNAHEIQGR
jgi:hypothetical protein